jgi:integrase
MARNVPQVVRLDYGESPCSRTAIRCEGVARDQTPAAQPVVTATPSFRSSHSVAPSLGAALCSLFPGLLGQEVAAKHLPRHQDSTAEVLPNPLRSHRQGTVAVRDSCVREVPVAPVRVPLKNSHFGTGTLAVRPEASETSFLQAGQAWSSTDLRSIAPASRASFVPSAKAGRMSVPFGAAMGSSFTDMKLQPSANPVLTRLRVSVPELAARLDLAIRQCMSASTASSTQGTYESAFRQAIGLFPEDSWQAILPCTSTGHATLIFAALSGKAWSSIRVARAALRQWHLARGFIDAWCQATESHEFAAFWRGLKRGANHVTSPTIALDLGTLRKLLAKCVEGPDTLAGVRDAAWLAATFFGVRRIGETAKLSFADIEWTEVGYSMKVRFAKNDPDGQGQVVVVPRMPALGASCPVSLLKNWFDRVGSAQILPERPLFFVTKGKRAGLAATDASIRCRLDRLLVETVPDLAGLRISTHSLRKGGASWWRAQGVSNDVVQAQGGWRTQSTMNQVYLDADLAARNAELVAAASAQNLVEPARATLNRPPSKPSVPLGKAKAKRQPKTQTAAAAPLAKRRGRPPLATKKAASVVRKSPAAKAPLIVDSAVARRLAVPKTSPKIKARRRLQLARLLPSASSSAAPPRRSTRLAGGTDIPWFPPEAVEAVTRRKHKK